MRAILLSFFIACAACFGQAQSPSGAAGGDLSGSYPNPKVNTIGGKLLGTAAYQPTSSFDVSGAAAAAQSSAVSTAEVYSSNAANTLLQHGTRRSTESASLDSVNVRDYGAIGDGASHAACSTFSGVTTLAQLQAYAGGIFSFATACTNQVDWLAAQYAVNLITSQGGRVFFPHGTYLFDQPLVLPLSYDGSGTSKAVYLSGEGSGGTFIQPSVSDFGAGSALVSCGAVNASYSANSNTGNGRYASLTGCFGGLEDITFNNPYYTTTTTVTSTAYSPSSVINVPAPSYNGGSPIQMDGIKIGARMYLHKVSVWGFRMGINVVGDHMAWDNLTLQHNFCGFYLAPPSIYLFGDIVMSGHNLINGNTLGGICVDKDAILSMYQQGELYLGYQPYGMLKFAGTSDSYGEGYGGSATPFIMNARFDMLQAESLGNAILWDDSLTNPSGGVNASGTSTIEDMTINQLFTSWDSAEKVTTGGRGSYAYIGVQYASGLSVKLTAGSGNMYAGATGQLAGMLVRDLGYEGGGIDISGEINDPLANYTSAGIEFIGQLSQYNPHCDYITLHETGMWDGGEIAIPNPGGIPLIGQALQSNGPQGASVDGGSAPVIGIAMSNTRNTAGGQCIAYANRGFVSVKTAVAPTDNSTLVATTAGAGVTLTSSGGYIIGTVQNGSSGTSIVSLAPGGYVPNTAAPSITGGTINSAPIGATIPSTGAFTSLSTTNTIASTVGTAIASAATIAPTAEITHVTGTASITTITIPSGYSAKVGGCITLVADGAWKTAVGGNIYVAMTATPGVPYQACYDGSKWYLK